MKKLSSNLSSHVKNEVTTLCYCWLITRKDGLKQGFTSHDNNITLENTTYLASSGFSPSSISNNSELSVDNLEIEGVLDNSALKHEEILAGTYDFAEIEIFMINYKKAEDGKINLRSGWLGEIKFSQNRFITEVRGISQKLSQTIGKLYSSRCRTIFADEECGLNINSFKYNGTVTEVISDSIFIDSSLNNNSGFFNNGKVRFTTGKNQGHTIEIKRFSSTRVELVLPLSFTTNIGDNYDIFQGCDKSFSTCINKYNNAVNFRGEPHVPGIDQILKTP